MVKTVSPTRVERTVTTPSNPVHAGHIAAVVREMRDKFPEGGMAMGPTEDPWPGVGAMLIPSLFFKSDPAKS